MLHNANMTHYPIDTATGLQSGPSVHSTEVEVQVGFFATHGDGTTALLRLDRTRAEVYAVTHHATIEPMYVRRPRQP